MSFEQIKSKLPKKKKWNAHISQDLQTLLCMPTSWCQDEGKLAAGDKWWQK